MSDQFTEKYPASKYAKEDELIKKQSEQGIIDSKRILAEAATNERLYRKIQEEKYKLSPLSQRPDTTKARK